MELLKFNGATPHGTIDSSLTSESHQSDEWNFGFNFNSSYVGEDNHSSDSYFKTKNNQDDNNRNNASPTNIDVDSHVNFFDSESDVTQHEVLNQFDIIFYISCGIVSFTTLLSLHTF